MATKSEEEKTFQLPGWTCSWWLSIVGWEKCKVSANIGPSTESTGNPLLNCSVHNFQNMLLSPTAPESRADLSTLSAMSAWADNSLLKRQFIRRKCAWTVFCGLGIATRFKGSTPANALNFLAIKCRTIMAFDTYRDFLFTLCITRTCATRANSSNCFFKSFCRSMCSFLTASTLTLPLHHNKRLSKIFHHGSLQDTPSFSWLTHENIPCEHQLHLDSMLCQDESLCWNNYQRHKTTFLTELLLLLLLLTPLVVILLLLLRPCNFIILLVI